MHYILSNDNYDSFPQEVVSFCQSIEDLEENGIDLEDLADWHEIITDWLNGSDFSDGIEHCYGVYNLEDLENSISQSVNTWAIEGNEFNILCEELDDEEIIIRSTEISLAPFLKKLAERFDCTFTICKYIENSLVSFVEESIWHVGLQDETSGQIIENIEAWPTPKQTDREIAWETDKQKYSPVLWFGPEGMQPLEPWTIKTSLSPLYKSGADSWEIIKVVLDDPNDYYLTWYTAEIGCICPDIEEVLKVCPISFSHDDEDNVVQNKLRQFFWKAKMDV